MDTSGEIYVMTSQDNMFDLSYGSEANYVKVAEVSKKFYENHEDIYDFINIFTTFDTDKPSSNHQIVQNIKGIGQNIYDNSKNHGSNGKLKSIVFMRNINPYDVSSDTFRFGLINLLLHETGHQWCCYVGSNFARGKDNAKLEIIQQGIHFYGGLQSPNANGDPLGSDHWVKGEDGFYKIPYIHPSEPQKYHPFQLYFMGLLPEDEYGNKFTIYDAGIVGEDYNRERGKPYKEVSVNDIIALEGKRSCVS